MPLDSNASTKKSSSRRPLESVRPSMEAGLSASRQNYGAGSWVGRPRSPAPDRRLAVEPADVGEILLALVVSCWNWAFNWSMS